MGYVKNFNEMNAEQQMAYRVGYRAALEKERDPLRAALAKAEERNRELRDELERYEKDEHERRLAGGV